MEILIFIVPNLASENIKTLLKNLDVYFVVSSCVQMCITVMEVDLQFK